MLKWRGSNLWHTIYQWHMHLICYYHPKTRIMEFVRFHMVDITGFLLG